MKRIWITRALPGAEATAARLRALAFDPVIAPLLRVRRLDSPLDLAGVGALAFTSANGVRAFAALSAERDLPVFTVGDATAAGARQAGFADVGSAGGDVGALARLVAAEVGRFAGVVLHPGAAEPAGDLMGALRAKGVPGRSVALYDTVEAAPNVGDLESFDAVLVHSPKAGRRLAEILAERPARRLIAVCISAEAGGPLDGAALGRVVAAPLPSEDALLSLLVHETRSS